MIRRIAQQLLAPQTGPTVRTPWWQVMTILVAGGAIALFRLPIERWNTLWAEDGADFLTGALRHDPFTIFEPYYGYLHVVPRTVAALVVAVAPLDWMPLAMTVLAALLAAVVACAVFLFARLRIRSVVLCAALALGVVVLPIAGTEVAASAANLHGYLVFGAFWAAIVTPPSRWLTVVQCVAVGAAVLSDPLASALLLPLVVARLVGVRPLISRSHAVTVVYLVTTVIQGTAVVLQTLVDDPREFSETKPGPLAFGPLYAGRVVLESLLGVKLAIRFIDSTGYAGLWGALALLLAAVVALAWLDRDRRVLVVTFATASVCFTYLELWFAWHLVKEFGIRDLTAGARYWVVPVLLLVSVYCIGADHLAQRMSGRLAWVPIGALVALVLAPGVHNYRLVDIRAGAPDWHVGITEAAEFCRSEPSPDLAQLTIAPPWFRPAQVPCDLIEASRLP